MNALVRLVVLIPVDAGANPETAAIARHFVAAVSAAGSFREFVFRLPDPVDLTDGMDFLKAKFREMFPSDLSGESLPSPFVDSLRSGPPAMTICGVDLEFRYDGLRESPWMTLMSWRNPK